MMSYRRRIGVAGLGSFAIHGLAAALLALSVFDTPRGIVPASQPIVVSLRPPERDTARNIVDPGAPADSRPERAELVSDRNTRAQDMSETNGDPDRPSLDSDHDFEELGAPAAPPVAPAPEQAEAPPPQPPSDEAAPVAEESVVEPEPPATDTQAPKEEPRAPQQSAAQMPEETPAKPQGEPAPAASSKPSPEIPERFQLAREAPSLPAPATDGEEARGRKGGGVETEGFTSFEASEHELGAYMLGIRKKVERTWKTALRFRYSGSSATAAVLECAIRPDGTLEYVKIVDPGGSATYAALCKDAVQQAGPFGIFPFPVPDVYRTKNLIVKWKFSFM